MKIAQYVETFSYVGMFNKMNFASYICLYLISPFMQHPVSIQEILINVECTVRKQGEKENLEVYFPLEALWWCGSIAVYQHYRTRG